MNDTFFLCFGYPKSGTTFLQRMLDLHPQVSCPAEQSFSTLARLVENNARAYNEALKIVDRRTGGQGAPVWGKGTSDRVFAAIIKALAKDFAKGRPIHGLNDNSVVQQPKFYDEILDRPRMIAIFRNPVDQALSAWRHNTRLAIEEPHMASVHLGNLQNREGTVEGYVMKLATDYVGWVSRYLAYVGDRSNFLTLRYEALVEDKRNELRRLFEFLGAEASPSTVEAIVANSSKEKMASRSNRPEFFGVGARQGAITVNAAVRERALAIAARGLERLGYDVNSLLAAA